MQGVKLFTPMAATPSIEDNNKPAYCPNPKTVSSTSATNGAAPGRQHNIFI
jgi:hypothetical protein